MNKSITLLLLFCTAFLSAQNLKNSPWHIVADDIDPNNYYGVTVVNGMVGMISSPDPLKVKGVILNGVYDYYQRGRVSTDGVKQLPSKLPIVWKSLTIKRIGKDETTFTLNK